MPGRGTKPRTWRSGQGKGRKPPKPQSGTPRGTRPKVKINGVVRTASSGPTVRRLWDVSQALQRSIQAQADAQATAKYTTSRKPRKRRK